MPPPLSAELTQRLSRLGERLGERGQRLLTVESCTGGWLAATLSAIPGSSRWFEGSLVTYSNRMKQALVQVPAAMLDQNGAVSEQVVSAMARGGLALGNVQYAIAISGIAGPEGGTSEKPVGTVWFAWSGPGRTLTECCHFQGDRQQIRWQAVLHAIDGLANVMGSPGCYC